MMGRGKCKLCGDGRGGLVAIKDTGEGLDSVYVMCDQCCAYTKPMYHIPGRAGTATIRAWNAWNAGEVSRA